MYQALCFVDIILLNHSNYLVKVLLLPFHQRGNKISDSLNNLLKIT